MTFKEISKGVYEAKTAKGIFTICNCHFNKGHKLAKGGNNFMLYVAGIDGKSSRPLGDFWSLPKAKEGAENIHKLLKARN